LDRLFLKDILSDIGKGGIGNHICFQMTLAIITPALIAGVFAERMKFSAVLVGDLRLRADCTLGLGTVFPPAMRPPG
jgi:hypothetical protein